MRGLVLFIVAKIIIAMVYVVGFTWSVTAVLFKSGWKALDRYLLNCAIADDQHGNTYLAKMFNDVLIRPGGHRFGNPDETISSVLGKNELTGTLTAVGRGVNWILGKLERNHSVKSIEHPTSRNIV